MAYYDWRILGRYLGPTGTFGGNSGKLNIEQWRCVHTLRGHSGGESDSTKLNDSHVKCTMPLLYIYLAYSWTKLMGENREKMTKIFFLYCVLCMLNCILYGVPAWHFVFTAMLDVLDLAWSPDDSFLASGSVDNTITIWNAQRFPGLDFLHAIICYVHVAGKKI